MEVLLNYPSQYEKFKFKVWIYMHLCGTCIYLYTYIDIHNGTMLSTSNDIQLWEEQEKNLRKH